MPKYNLPDFTQGYEYACRHIVKKWPEKSRNKNRENNGSGAILVSEYKLVRKYGVRLDLSGVEICESTA